MEFRFPRGWLLEQSRTGAWNVKVRGFRLRVWMRPGKDDAANVIERRIALKRRLTTTREDVTYKIIRNDRPLRLAGDKVAGTTYYEGLHDSIGTVRTYYALRTGPDTVLFTFSELRMDGLPGEPSTEWKEMERWLQESLKVLPPADK